MTDLLLQPPTSLPFTAVPGINTILQRNASPLHYFELILQTTNAYAAARLGSQPPQRCSVFWNWRGITLTEMKAFVGLILQMGLTQLSDIKDYWSTHVTLNLPFFRTVFSRDRFFQIFWMLHVGETPSQAKSSHLLTYLFRDSSNTSILLKSSPLTRR